VAFIWGATFVLVKSALDDVSALLYLALRFALAGFVLGVAYRGRLSGVFDGRSKGLRGGVLAGCFVFLAYVFQTTGLNYTTPSKNAFLTGLAIVLVPLLNSAVFRVKPKAVEIAGVGVAVAGMALMTLERGDLGANPGDLLTLVGAVFFAAQIITIGHYAPRQGFERLSILQVATAALLSLATFGWAEEPFIEWTPTVLFAVGVTGVLCTAAAFTIQAWVQQRTTPNRTALIITLEPVFAALTSLVVLGEVLSGRAMAGAVLILAGILLVELKPQPRDGHPKKQKSGETADPL
jgi:drug/metabolite transporter (DMT)-like permease